MKVTKATSNEKMQEHLCEMMERLLDDELFQEKDKAMVEIEKARAMTNLVDQSLNIQKVELQQNQLKLNAMNLLFKAGYVLDDLEKIGFQVGNSITGVQNVKKISQSVDI